MCNHITTYLLGKLLLSTSSGENISVSQLRRKWCHQARHSCEQQICTCIYNTNTYIPNILKTSWIFPFLARDKKRFFLILIHSLLLKKSKSKFCSFALNSKRLCNMKRWDKVSCPKMLVFSVNALNMKDM